MNARKAEVELQDKAAVGGAETCQTLDAIGWRPASLFPGDHAQSMGLTWDCRGGFPPRIDANQRRKGQWRSKRDLCERRWPLEWVGDGLAALDAEMSRKSSVRDGGRMREGKVTALTAALLVRNGVEAHSPVP